MPIQIALDSLKQAASGTANSATFLRGDNTFVAANVAANSAIASPVFSGTAIGTYTLAGTPTITNPTLTLQSENVSPFIGFRNRIINGAMLIDQRNAGASVTVGMGAFIADRFRAVEVTDGTATGQQSSTAPAGFVNSILFTVTGTDSSLGATQYASIEQRVEGLNIADLAWGTASAAPITISFWVRSSVTGTYCVGLYNSAGNRSYTAEYTINSANTWEQKTITVAGDTTGTWLTTNGIGVLVSFTLAVGSSYQQAAGSWGSTAFAIGTSNQTNLMATNGATFYITGVQLERGSVATSFDYRSFGTELGLCQRYYYKSYSTGTLPGTSTAAGGWFSQNYAANAICIINARWIVEMRNAPTVTTYSLNGTSGKLSDALGTDQTSTATNSGTSGCIAYIITGTLSEANGHFVASAEL